MNQTADFQEYIDTDRKTFNIIHILCLMMKNSLANLHYSGDLLSTLSNPEERLNMARNFNEEVNLIHHTHETINAMAKLNLTNSVDAFEPVSLRVIMELLRTICNQAGRHVAIAYSDSIDWKFFVKTRPSSGIALLNHILNEYVKIVNDAVIISLTEATKICTLTFRVNHVSGMSSRLRTYIDSIQRDLDQNNFSVSVDQSSLSIHMELLRG